MLTRLHLLPTCGTQYYRLVNGDVTTVYARTLTDDQKERALRAVEEQARRLGLWESDTWGDILEDRGSQITFSALGQKAPVDAKAAWDPTGEKKNALRAAVAELLPDLEVRSGGSTSVDITERGIDKSYGMTRLSEQTGIPLDDMLFIGDRLDPAGNDYPVLAMGVSCTPSTGGRTPRPISSSSSRCCPSAEPRPQASTAAVVPRGTRRVSCVTWRGSSSSSEDTPRSVIVRSISVRRISIVRSTPARPPAMRP